MGLQELAEAPEGGLGLPDVLLPDGPLQEDVAPQADRLPDPSLAATLLWGKVEKVREEIAKLEQDAQTANGDQARLRIETEITRRRVKLREYEGQLDFYIQAGSRPQGLRPVGAPPRAPQGAVQVGPDAQRAARLKAAGVVE